MKPVLLALAVSGMALAIVAAAVFGAGDRSTLVPTSENVAEDFTRKLALGRYELAWRRLSSDARERERVEQLRGRFAAIAERLGGVNLIEAVAITQAENTATTSSRIDAEHGEATLSLTLSRENGLWVIDSWNVAQ